MIKNANQGKKHTLLITISQFINITKGVLYEQGNHYHQQHYTDLKTRIVGRSEVHV